MREKEEAPLGSRERRRYLRGWGELGVREENENPFGRQGVRERRGHRGDQGWMRRRRWWLP